MNNFYLKIKIKIQKIFKRVKKFNFKRVLKNPFFCFIKQKINKKNYLVDGNFYFGLFSFVLLGLLFFGSQSLAQLSNFDNKDTSLFNPFFESNENLNDETLFFDQKRHLSLETPDLKIIQDSFVYAISTPRLLTPQTLGTIFGGSAQNKKDINEYSVQPGDTIESISQNFNISFNTLIWANNLSKSSVLKTDQKLVILPTDGIVHIVKSGDTLSEIAKVYKSKIDDIVAFNDLVNEGDIFIGDILIVPYGIMPKKSVPTVTQAQLADSFFINPTEGYLSQGLHWYNAIDIANKCGTPIYAAAAGTVKRAAYGWNGGGGNFITILHSGEVVTYYGHLMSLFVQSGTQVNVGDRIGLMGNTGKSTGCHLHFGVTGAKNPFTRYNTGSIIKYK